MVADPDGLHAAALRTAADLCLVNRSGTLYLFLVLAVNRAGSIRRLIDSNYGIHRAVDRAQLPHPGIGRSAWLRDPFATTNLAGDSNASSIVGQDQRKWSKEPAIMQP